METPLMMNKNPIDKKKMKRIYDWMQRNSSYGYYSEPSSLKNAKDNLFDNPGVNCSDIDTVEENIKELRKEYVKKHIMRKATPEELEYLSKQPKVDLNDPEHKHLKKALQKMKEEGWFD